MQNQSVVQKMLPDNWGKVPDSATSGRQPDFLTDLTGGWGVADVRPSWWLLSTIALPIIERYTMNKETSLTPKQTAIVSHLSRSVPPRQRSKFKDDVLRRLAGSDQSEASDMQVTRACVDALVAQAA